MARVVRVVRDESEQDESGQDESEQTSQTLSGRKNWLGIATAIGTSIERVSMSWPEDSRYARFQVVLATHCTTIAGQALTGAGKPTSDEDSAHST